MAFTKIRALMTKLSDNFPFLGTVTGTTVADNSITNAKFASTIAASNFSGALPAIDGSALTGLSATTNAASDPAIDTNGTLGDVYINTTSGETYICTDATTDANTWINVGGGDGDIIPYSFQGTNYGYVYGGTYPTSADVQQFSFSADGNATDVGDQSVQRQSYTAASSTTHGYCMGGAVGTRDVIDKFAFAVANGFTMTDVGNLTMPRSYSAGMSTASYGFCAGGDNSGAQDRIDRIDFSSDGDATDWANLHTARSAASNGISGTTHGYTAGGASDQIQKFQFASQSTGTDVGNLTTGWTNQSGATSSTTHGFVVGSSGTPSSKVIQKFTFASDDNATTVGDISGATGIFLPGTASSTTHGYRAGGDTAGGGTPVNVIDKHSFSVDGNATDVGDLAHTQNYMGQGSQY